ASAALDMLLTGRNVYPRQALRLGLVDEIVSVHLLRTAAGARLLALSGGSVSAPRSRPIAQRALDGPLKSLVYRQALRRTQAQALGNYPAPVEIIKVVRQGLRRGLAGGLEREARAFGRLMMTPEHKALRHLFFAGRAGRVGTEAEHSPVSQVGIVGAGLMGAGIATVCLDKGLTVRQMDVDLPALAVAHGHIQAWFDGRVNRRIRSRREAELTLVRYSVATDYSGFGRAQAVVEAVHEDLDVKRQVIADLEARVSHATVIATNTSSLSIAAIAEGAAHPERIVGMHFFSPVEKMPLLEIVPSRHTNPRTLATATALGRLLGKTVIVGKDSPGFYVNRILTPYLNETFKLLEDGIAIDTLDRYAQQMGFPVGPCTLLDEVGLDVASKVSETMLPLVGKRLELSDHNRRFAADNRLGRKNGRGFYTYVRGRKGKVDASVYELLDHPHRRSLPYDDVRQRLLSALLNECAQALDENLIADPSEGDMGAVYGFGFPPFLGGPFWALDQIGLPQFVAQLRELQARHGPRFTPAPGLVSRSEAGDSYFSRS
ncbi:MAG: 3-hydroxyacyl-CoA dehydrogenase NAD-binding domain-containing protein, partial [Candidatus Neomarinimicrobiota bacterium]